MDVEPIEEKPTWVHKKTWKKIVVKRLDGYIVTYDVLIYMGTHRSWVGEEGAYDDFIILI
jgi:hypothetical protein